MFLQGSKEVTAVYKPSSKKNLQEKFPTLAITDVAELAVVTVRKGFNSLLYLNSASVKLPQHVIDNCSPALLWSRTDYQGD